MKGKILIIDAVHPLIREELEKAGYTCDFFPGLAREELLSIAPAYRGVIVRSKFRIDREFIDRATGLTFIGRVGAGMENIDVEYAAAKGIACYNSPEGNRDAVGEHAVGMLLSLMNNMNRADRQVRQGTWDREGNRGHEIMGRTVGIIGYGNMGSAFARCLSGFGARVIAYDKYKRDYSNEFVAETTMEELFRECDIVSMHVPLTGETKYMADDTFFSSFSKPVWFLNTSRGGVVRTADLVKHLDAGKILGAALDVLEYEDTSFEKLQPIAPPDLQYLLASDRVILTPHIAGWTVESNIKLARVLVGKILEGLRRAT